MCGRNEGNKDVMLMEIEMDGGRRMGKMNKIQMK